jgi:glucose-1-phosphatase
MTLPQTEQALELHTPIGSKLVFEKWSDGQEEYVAVNLVYQSVYQLQGRTLLSEEVPPMVQPVVIEGLTANDDGLYRMADVDNRMAETMAEYDAIEDVPTSVPVMRNQESQHQAYTLSGTQATDSTRGIVIENNQKVVRK